MNDVLNWLLRDARFLSSPELVIESLCERLNADGLPIDRAAVYLFSLHPLYAGVRYVWEEGKLTTDLGSHEFMASRAYAKTPMHDIARGAMQTIRRRLRDTDCPDDYPLVAEFRSEGFTDYVALPIRFSDGSINSVSIATRDRHGFTEDHIQSLNRIGDAFSLLIDNFRNRELASTLMQTYVGRISGERVWSGQIRRGDGDVIDAIIWFSDLRNSTALTEALGHESFLALLNEYFDATAGAVAQFGGEILRFIGDASLAVFPVDDAARFDEVAERAVAAAKIAVAESQRRSQARVIRGEVAFDCGIALNYGRVLYGNIGTDARLEFSVIGAAANEAARMEGLCRDHNTKLVVAESIANAVGAKWRNLGSLPLRGVSGERNYFAL